jgi:KaiC/GvpD/RAD55 family RecA-like ATPase
MRATFANKPLSVTDTPDVEAAYGAISKARPIVLRPVHEIVAEQREPEWLIHKVIERNVLAVIAGPRSTFKSFIALDWAMRMALDGYAGVILSGEGGGLDRRVAVWMKQHRENVDLSTVPLDALERPLNLNSIVELEALREVIDKLPTPPAFIVIDTFSKFSAGLDENNNSEVAAFLSALSVFREEWKCTVILVAHSGHGDAKRPRGASSLMSNPDAEYIVNRPDPNGMVVTVSRERFKDAPSLAPLAYEARLIDLGPARSLRRACDLPGACNHRRAPDQRQGPRSQPGQARHRVEGMAAHQSRHDPHHEHRHRRHLQGPKGRPEAPPRSPRIIRQRPRSVACSRWIYHPRGAFVMCPKRPKASETSNFDRGMTVRNVRCVFRHRTFGHPRTPLIFGSEGRAKFAILTRRSPLVANSCHVIDSSSSEQNRDPDLSGGDQTARFPRIRRI